MRAILSLGVLALCLTSCRPVPRPADPALARAALTAALDNWQRGAGEASLSGRTVAVRDRDRKAGLKLVKYHLGEPEPVSYDFRCPVTLALTDSGGKRLIRKAVYNVTTSPSLFVARVDDD